MAPMGEPDDNPERSENPDRSAEQAALFAEKRWLKILAGYRQPRAGRSAFELAVTVVPFALFWAAAWAAVHYSFWPGLILVLPAAAFLLRLFMIQHDCGHGSFFARRRVDDWVGRTIGILTLTPYDYWRRAHAEHHASAGNLDERGVGDIETLTIAEYNALSHWGRLGYRLYRHPIVMFGIGPAWLFLFKQRLPFGMMRSGALPWISTMATNLAIAMVAALLIWAVGIVPFTGASSDRASGRCCRRLAVLRPASIRGNTLVEGAGLAVPVCGPARRLALRPAAGAALDHRQYRHPPRASSVEPGAVLPAAGGATRSS